MATHLHAFDRDELAARGVFIIGHARSGTSVLQYALNTSPEIAMLNEANLHTSAARSNFAAWYNSMHESFRNPISKDDRCPDIDGDGWAVLHHLARRHRLVGDKLAFRSRSLGYEPEGALRFLQRHFSASHYLCTLRNPRDVLISNRELFKVDDITPYVWSYIESLATLISTVFLFERTLVVVFERIEARTFHTIGKFLGCALPAAYREYDRALVSSRRSGVLGVGAELLARAVDWHRRIAALIDRRTLRPQNRFLLRRLQREIYQFLPEEEAKRERTDQKLRGLHAGADR